MASPAAIYRSIRHSHTPARLAPSLAAVEALARRRARADRPEDKRDLLCWSPHALVDGGVRTLADVQSVSALVLDYDHLEGADPREPLRWWPGVRAWMHDTYSSRADAWRVRLVLPLAAPIQASDWRDLYLLVLHDLAMPGGDESCADSTRLHALPCRHADGSPGWWYARRRRELLDLRPLVPIVRERAEVRKREAEERRRRRAKHWKGGESYSRLPDDPWEKAQLLGGHVVETARGPVIRGLICPACGRHDAWMPGLGYRVRCSHLRSCGYVGKPLLPP